MILEVFSVYDKAVNAYMQPFYARSKGEAIRSFTELVNDKSTNPGKYPTDFDLMYLGQYDDNSALFSGSGPVRVLAATEVLRDDVVFPPGSQTPPQRLSS